MAASGEIERHAAPRARSVIFLFMEGGVSQGRFVRL